MRRIAARCKLATLVVTIFILLLASTVVAQNFPKEQCSLAVVSRLVGSDQRVCDSKVVQEMAQHGHAFEQNQLGIASILAIGPDYSEKEAVKWFEQAAQRGYAPARSTWL